MAGRERECAACDAGGAAQVGAPPARVSRAWVDRLQQRRRETDAGGGGRRGSSPPGGRGIGRNSAPEWRRPGRGRPAGRRGEACGVCRPWGGRGGGCPAQEKKSSSPQSRRARLVCIAESGVAPTLPRRGGCGPHGHGPPPPFGGALRRTGRPAPLVGEGPLTREACRASVAPLFVPPRPPDASVSLAPLSGHNASGSAPPIAPAGAPRHWLPPARPALTPLAGVFATRQGLGRGVAKRTREALWPSLGPTLSPGSPLEGQHSFLQCGYTSPSTTLGPLTLDCSPASTRSSCRT